jgi:hypothetical protein
VIPLERVRRARRWLIAVLLLSALIRAVTLSLAVILVAALLDHLAPLAPGLHRWLVPGAMLAGLAGGGLMLWRGRALRSVGRVALWIEEHQPGLSFALVTAVDVPVASATLPAGLLAAAEVADIEGITKRAAGRALGRAGLLLAVVGLLLLLLAPRRFLTSRSASGEGPSGVVPAASRLAPLSVRVTAPAYSRLATRQLEEPGSVDALPGSGLTFAGRGDGSMVSIELGRDTLRPVQAGQGWSAVVRMPPAPAIITLRDREYRRLVILEPRPDSVPTLLLRLPPHDTTWQSPPTGRLDLEARATDDLGLVTGYFEFLISAGGGENFETTAGTSPPQPLGSARSAVLKATLLLDTLNLVPGSVLSIRAVALDANDVDGPGRGLSETRTLRVADQSDTTSVEAQPPDPIDETRISQRRLNMKTDTLIRSRRRLPHAEFIDRSEAYATLQLGIRTRVLEVVSLLEDADEEGSYPTEESRLLRDAADAMMLARRALTAAQPDSAMPHMRRALALLDQVRTAHRYYLRGRRRPELVDIARVRLQGKESGRPVALSSRPALSDFDAALAARIEAAARLHAVAPDVALDSLTYIRVSALATNPAVAAALKVALEELHRRVPADSALVPVRRLLASGGSALLGAPEWAGGTVP